MRTAPPGRASIAEPVPHHAARGSRPVSPDVPADRSSRRAPFVEAAWPMWRARAASRARTPRRARESAPLRFRAGLETLESVVPHFLEPPAKRPELLPACGVEVEPAFLSPAHETRGLEDLQMLRDGAE